MFLGKSTAWCPVTSAKPPTPAQAYERFRLSDHVHLVGALERGVTVYNQQVRAHNLIWALHGHSGREEPARVAVVGGGIAGLTAAACLLSAFETTKVELFERRWDLAPLQQGADHRWVHPHIYEWPADGSEQPSARIPLLGWKAASASTVLSQVLDKFQNCVTTFGKDRLTVYLGVEHLQILGKEEKTIEWTGRTSEERDGYYTAGKALGLRAKFDEIVLTPGFGLEGAPSGLTDMSYWRNEHRGQPILDGRLQTFVISGYGDGAIVDLCRLTIERFRQDRLLEELFPDGAEAARKRMLSLRESVESDNLFHLFEKDSSGVVAGALTRLGRRIRKDTKVFLHLSGKGGGNSMLPQVFGESSSFLNRFMLYLLYRCGAFVPTFNSLDDLIEETRVPLDNIVCRHGADTLRHVERLFNDGTKIRRRLNEIKRRQQQTPEMWFEPGFFRLP